MERLTGVKVSQGIAMGRIFCYRKEESQVIRRHITDTASEWQRYEVARKTAISELDQVYQKALQEVGSENAEIFQVHQMMLEDQDYNDSVQNMIDQQKVNAEYAVATTGDNFAAMFEAMDDDYFKARSADVRDISERVVRILKGSGEQGNLGDQPVILLAEDLAPSETVQMDKNKLLAFVTHLGSKNSHTAILARTMGIPAIVSVPISQDWDGKIGIVDGTLGELIVEPDQNTMDHYQQAMKQEEEHKVLLETLKGKENQTRSGKKVELFANIGKDSDLGMVLQNDAGGIGLFRSEFLYLEKDHLPTEEEQFQVYRHVLETMAGRKVVIRTMDIGADKKVDYLNLDQEENPALGLRAIRICLTRPEIFKAQLRALLRASKFGNLSIMYPMITSVQEVRDIKNIVEEVRQQLDKDGIPYGEPEQGIMIETPSAAIISDLLAKEVDFFSVGTNDLTQYTLAIDRQNTKLDPFCDPHHEAILRLLKLIVENAHKEGIWAGICGELGADTSLTQYFIDIGVDELSVSPAMVLQVRKAIRDCK